MKKILTLIVIALAAQNLYSQNSDTSKTALLIIDVQDFYFPGGDMELVNPQAAADNAALLLASFRQKGMPIIHIKHAADARTDIQSTVKPIEGEKIFTKSEISSFNGTGLNDYLKSIGVKNLVICGMQTHMCVEGAVRAGYDLGYKITLVHDACATRDLRWGDEVIPAKMVHLSTLSTLRSYAKIVSTNEFLAGK
ncbi:MAG: cysteine hydrolase [Bacteroidales bacterium]|nr:cysteine hydrolase [Bacteroidales bacterium]